MSQDSGGQPDCSVAEMLKAEEEQLELQLRSLKKVKTAFESGRKKMEKQPSSRKTLEKVIGDLQKLPTDATESATKAVSAVLPNLQTRLQNLSTDLERDLRKSLQHEAQQTGLDFGVAAGTMFLGPFALSLDLARESASLMYATVPVVQRLPLDAACITATCQQQTELLLAAPGDLARVASDLEQAMRVAVVRTGKNPGGAELRAELPAVYREMIYLQQSATRPLTKASVCEYPLPRFVVELKTLIQSDANLSSKRRFRLETAVIDSTRNSKKSVFVPNDIHKGYGEGMYYQALVLLTQS